MKVVNILDAPSLETNRVGEPLPKESTERTKNLKKNIKLFLMLPLKKVGTRDTIKSLAAKQESPFSNL